MSREEQNFIEEYEVTKYDRPSVTNDIIIFTTENRKEINKRKVPRKGMQVMLIKRDSYPYKGQWALPGGFVGMNESLEEAAKRKLLEKTGVCNIYLEQLFTFGDVNRDIRTRVISVAYMALMAKEKIEYKTDDEINNRSWFWVEKNLVKKEESNNEEILFWDLLLECGEEEIVYEVQEHRRKGLNGLVKKAFRCKDSSTSILAFDHYKIIDSAIDRLRNKVEYTAIAFNLLPRLFTVKELQYVYEAIVGKEILNFRRKIGQMIIETDEKIEGKPYRPAQVFKYNENWTNNNL